MALFEIITNLISPKQELIPSVDERLYTPNVRSNVNTAIKQHFYSLPNKTKQRELQHQGFAYIGTTICQSENDKSSLFLECAHNYGSIQQTDPLEIIYGQKSISSDEHSRNFQFLVSVPFGKRLGNMTLYRTFVRYTIPTTFSSSSLDEKL